MALLPVQRDMLIAEPLGNASAETRRRCISSPAGTARPAALTLMNFATRSMRRRTELIFHVVREKRMNVV